jgi:hypothetical protein
MTDDCGGVCLLDLGCEESAIKLKVVVDTILAKLTELAG